MNKFEESAVKDVHCTSILNYWYGALGLFKIPLNQIAR